MMDAFTSISKMLQLQSVIKRGFLLKIRGQISKGTILHARTTFYQSGQKTTTLRRAPNGISLNKNSEREGEGERFSGRSDQLSMIADRMKILNWLLPFVCNFIIIFIFFYFFLNIRFCYLRLNNNNNNNKLQQPDNTTLKIVDVI